MKFPKKIRWYMTYIIPIIVVVIYLKGYYDLFKPKGLKYLIPWSVIAFAFLILIFSFRFRSKKSKKQETDNQK